jgi:hypothetical protein
MPRLNGAGRGARQVRTAGSGARLTRWIQPHPYGWRSVSGRTTHRATVTLYTDEAHVMERPGVARSVLVVAGAAGYAGLAVCGEGGMAAFFEDPALLGLMVAYVAITVVSLFAGGNVSPGVREDRSNRWLLVVFGVLGLLAGYSRRSSGRNTIGIARGPRG